MAILIASLFLPHTVHFDIGNDSVNSRDGANGSAAKKIPAAAAKKIPSLNVAGSTPPLHSSPISSGIFIDKDSKLKSTSNEDFFYQNPLKAVSTHLLAPLGETDSDIQDPTKKYVLRRNQSFSYIQPQSRALVASASASGNSVERTSVDGDSAPPAMISRKFRGSQNDLRSLSQSRLSKVKQPKPSPLEKIKPRKTHFSLEEEEEEEEVLVPYGGFSSPDIGKKILQTESIFDTAPWKIIPYGKGNGGLRNAIMFSVEEKQISNVKWIGTVGMATDELSDTTKTNIFNTLKKEYNSKAVFADDFTFQGHYRNFCKQILWPTLHYQVPDDVKSKAFEDHSWEYYRKLNELFADSIAEEYKDGDVIWVHDYHLLLLPQMLRERLGHDAKIGFFLHSAFPSSEVFRCLAQRKNLLLGMIGANTIGFQTPEYCRHFLQTCNRILLADVANDEALLYDGKYIGVYSNPIGIDAKKLAAQIKDPTVDKLKQMIQERWKGKKLIVNRDKLDRLRGVKQKLLGYEIFLKQHPELVDQVIFVQICLRSTNNSDANLEYEILSIVERINSISNDISISPPVVFLHQDIEFQQYLALLSVADTFIVSTMREGMNLTCHEFIVATSTNKPPLILSEFTGSASIFNKGSLLINPWNLNQIASRIYQALTMKFEEKERRWDDLYSVLLEKNCYSWVNNSLREIKDSWTKQHERAHTTSLFLSNSQFSKTYLEMKKRNAKRLFILDLDSLGNGNDKLLNSSVLVSNRKLSMFSELASDPNNIVFIMSYLKRADIELKYGRLENVGLISENGGYLKLPKTGNHDFKKEESFPGSCSETGWISLVKELSWMKSAVQVLNSMVERLPGSYLEIQDCTIRYHCEGADDEERTVASISDCVTHINESFVEDNIHGTAIGKLVVIEPEDLPINGIKKIMEIYDDIDFLIYISTSNPITEPMFEYCNNLTKQDKVKSVFTVAAGQCGDTSAMASVGGLNELLSILSGLN